MTTEAAVFAPGPERAAMTVKIAVPEKGITDGGPEYDGPPLPRSVRILLITAAALAVLVLVGLTVRVVLPKR